MKKFKIVYLKNGNKFVEIYEHKTLHFARLSFYLHFAPDEIISVTELTEE